jgi:hypothetical protein
VISKAGAGFSRMQFKHTPRVRETAAVEFWHSWQVGIGSIEIIIVFAKVRSANCR